MHKFCWFARVTCRWICRCIHLWSWCDTARYLRFVRCSKSARFTTRQKTILILTIILTIFRWAGSLPLLFSAILCHSYPFWSITACWEGQGEPLPFLVQTVLPIPSCSSQVLSLFPPTSHPQLNGYKQVCRYSACSRVSFAVWEEDWS